MVHITLWIHLIWLSFIEFGGKLAGFPSGYEPRPLLDNKNMPSQFTIAATQYVAQSWEEVFQASNTVITQSRLFGLTGIRVIEDPNIPQILESMKLVSVMLDTVLGKLGTLDLDPDTVRLLLNAKEQVSRLEAVAAAIVADDEQLYNEAVEKLRQQAPF